MINFDSSIENITGIAALLIHAAKIDDNFSPKEEKIIIEFIKKFIKNDEEVNKIFKNALKTELDSNQLLNFTNIIKKNSMESKSLIIKELWKVLISDHSIDEYESNLMRRVCGLIYFPDKLSGEIKLSLLKN
ncbi:TerB family tellurite resistance protein [Pelagibacteraceae bacterium]|nr:TerB family tellurite resistance protein [Pelagibacteraceae bacterium]